MDKKLLFLLICSCLIACNHTEKGGQNVKHLYVDVSQKGTPSSSEIFSSVKIVPLETNDSVLVGSVSQIIHKDKNIYISDGTTLFKFSEEGRFVAKMNKKGNGPDEYQGITNFQIDSQEDVWILNLRKKTLYKYSLDGVMKDKIELNCWANTIWLLNDDTMLLYMGNMNDDGNKHQLKTFNIVTKKEEKGFFEIDSNQANYLHVISYDQFSPVIGSKDVYFFQTYSDTIYRVSGDAVHPAFYMDYNGKNIPESVFKKEYSDIRDFVETNAKYDYAYTASKFEETPSFFLTSFVYGGLRLSLIAKDGGNAKNFTEIKEDVFLKGYSVDLIGPVFERTLFIQKDGEIIVTMEASDIIEYVSERFGKEEVETVKRTIGYQGEDQNPVLLVGVLK